MKYELFTTMYSEKVPKENEIFPKLANQKDNAKTHVSLQTGQKLVQHG